MKVSFSGIGEQVVTFEAYGTVKAGDAVTMYGNGTVQACSNGGAFMGIAVSDAADGLVAVQVGGIAEVKYSGTAPSVGVCHLVADGNNGVKKDAGTACTATAGSGTHDLTDYTGGEYVALYVDTTAGIVGFIM